MGHDAITSDEHEKGYAAYHNRQYSIVLQEFKPLAEAGFAAAQNILGYLSGTGVGVSKNYSEAVNWFRLAENQGFAAAQYNLGVMHREGNSVPQDYVAASQWFARAAEQGLAEAQYNLGVMHREGQGAPQDYQTAHMWLNIAAMGGDEGTLKIRDLVAKELITCQLGAAQKMAREWFAKNYTGY